MDEFTAVRVRVDLRIRAAIVAVAAAASLGAGEVGSTASRVDAQFVDAVRAEGRLLPGKPDGGATLVAAARKICLRRDHHDTVAQRRAAKLTSGELAAVRQSYATDSGRFVTLALDTYCP